jgi:hypothetical protein
MMLKNAKIYKDNVILTQKNTKGEWESLTWTEFGGADHSFGQSVDRYGDPTR